MPPSTTNAAQAIALHWLHSASSLAISGISKAVGYQTRTPKAQKDETLAKWLSLLSLSFIQTITIGSGLSTDLLSSACRPCVGFWDCIYETIYHRWIISPCPENDLKLPLGTPIDKVICDKVKGIPASIQIPYSKMRTLREAWPLPKLSDLVIL